MIRLRKLTLSVPTLLEEEVVDRLLESDADIEFTVGTVYAHASGEESLSLAEQVTGRKRRVRFEIVGDADDVQALLDALRDRFKGSGIHFLLEPIEARGFL